MSWAARWAAGPLLVAAVVGVLLGPPLDAPTAVRAVGALVLGAAMLVAAVLVRDTRGPSRRLGLLGLGLLVSAVTVTWAAASTVVAALDTRVVAAVLALLVPAVALAVPADRLRGRGEHAAVAAVAAVGVAVVVAPVPVLAVVGAIVVVIGVATAVGLRFERARDVDRERILWLLFGGGTATVVGGHLFFAADAVATGPGWVALCTAVVLSGLLVPVTVTVALVAPRVADVRRAIGATVVLVIMIDVALGCFTGTLAVVEAVGGRPPSRLVAALVCVVVAAGFHPVTVRVREALDQVLFGGRPDPVGVVTSLGAELQRGGGPQQWLDALRVAVGVPYAELCAGGERLAVSGATAGPTTRLTLPAGDDHVGDLVVGLPEHHRELPRDTERVLRLVAAPLARALQSARLAEEVQRSRQRVVVASEEERRRVRRDLHDGLGPVLSGVAYTADAARNVLAEHPERAAGLLGELRDDVSGAIAEVRRIVHDLRPPALDQLGLVPAVRQQAARMPLDVTVEAGELPPLPAAVEVAAYRLVTEALLNATRHASATSATVTIDRTNRTLTLRVTDDGRSDVDWAPGVGLTSMRERVEQLDGSLTVGPTPDGGEVHAVLPLGAAVSPGRGASAPAARPG